MDSDHDWRGNPKELDLWREWIRRNIESGREGFVFEDIDHVPWLVARRFWRVSDPIGRFLVIEKKLGDAGMDPAQIRTFGLWDHLTRRGEPLRKRYMGWYLLNHPHENPWECTHVTINGKRLTMDEFKLFLKFELDLPPYEFPDYVKG